MDIGNLLSRILSPLQHYFTAHRRDDLNLIISLVAPAIPIIQMVARAEVALTPTGLDDATLDMFIARYPRLLDGSPKTEDELKLYMLALATELLKRQHPEATTTIARAAVQLAYAAEPPPRLEAKS